MHRKRFDLEDDFEAFDDEAFDDDEDEPDPLDFSDDDDEDDDDDDPLFDYEMDEDGE